MEQVMQSGHVLVGDCGEMLSIDRGFSVIMQASPASLVGRPVLDVTAPADREECGCALAELRATRRPFEITKRFVRTDGSLIWVRNTVSMVDHGRDANLIVATVTPIVEAGDRAPARLLRIAKTLAHLQLDRAARFADTLRVDMPWSALLAAYIAEAEGRAITPALLAKQFAIPRESAERWLRTLVAQGVVEIETRERDPYAPKSFRLTAAAHAEVENHLAIADGERQAEPVH